MTRDGCGMCEGNGDCDGFGSGCSDGSAEAIGVGEAVRPGPPINVNRPEWHGLNANINTARAKIRNVLMLPAFRKYSAPPGNGGDL